LHPRGKLVALLTVLVLVASMFTGSASAETVEAPEWEEGQNWSQGFEMEITKKDIQDIIDEMESALDQMGNMEGMEGVPDEYMDQMPDINLDSSLDAFELNMGMYQSYEVTDSGKEIEVGDDTYTCYVTTYENYIGFFFVIGYSIDLDMTQGEESIDASGSMLGHVYLELDIEGKFYWVEDTLALARIEFDISPSIDIEFDGDMDMSGTMETYDDEWDDYDDYDDYSDYDDSYDREYRSTERISGGMDAYMMAKSSNILAEFEMDFEPPLDIFDFPIEDGESWSAESSVTSRITNVEGKIDYKVDVTVSGDLKDEMDPEDLEDLQDSGSENIGADFEPEEFTDYISLDFEAEEGPKGFEDLWLISGSDANDWDYDDYYDDYDDYYDDIDYESDSDGDGLTDWYEENIYYTDPYDTDTDGDGYDDYEESYTYFTDPNDSSDTPEEDVDSDGDGYYDWYEDEEGTDPYDPNDYPGHSGEDDTDTDGDGLTDDEENYYYWTDPENTDSDGDGYSDYEEIMEMETDANDPYDPDEESYRSSGAPMFNIPFFSVFDDFDPSGMGDVNPVTPMMTADNYYDPDEGFITQSDYSANMEDVLGDADDPTGGMIPMSSLTTLTDDFGDQMVSQKVDKEDVQNYKTKDRSSQLESVKETEKEASEGDGMDWMMLSAIIIVVVVVVAVIAVVMSRKKKPAAPAPQAPAYGQAPVQQAPPPPPSSGGNPPPPPPPPPQ